MPKLLITSKTLNLLSDGYVGRLIDKAFDEVQADLLDRGHDAQPRKVTIEFSMVAKPNGYVEIAPTVQVKKPPMRPMTTTAKIDSRAGGYMFNPDLADNPDQETINDLPEMQNQIEG